MNSRRGGTVIGELISRRRRNNPEIRVERITIWLAFDTSTQLRLEAARSRDTLSVIVERALEKYLGAKKKP